MLKIDPKVMLDYSANVLPKKASNLPLSKFDQLIDKAVSCAENNNEKGLKSVMELIGRLMVKK